MMRKRAFMFCLISTALFCVPEILAGQKDGSMTLREALHRDGAPVASDRLPNLDKRISSWAELSADTEYVIAYHLLDGANNLLPPIYLSRYDKKEKNWKSAPISSFTTAGREDAGVPCLGSVLEVKRFGEYLLLDTHINPSAGCVLVVNRELKLKAGLYGWFLQGIGANEIVYHRSEIHFAAVHATEIALYDLATARDITLFPPKQDAPIRTAITKRLSEFQAAHADWCTEHNDPCDPKQIDSELVGEVAENAEADALALVISYGNERQREAVQKPEGPHSVLYVYRHIRDDAKREFREMPLEEAKSRFHSKELSDLVTADKLKEIFAKGTSD